MILLCAIHCPMLTPSATSEQVGKEKKKFVFVYVFLLCWFVEKSSFLSDKSILLHCRTYQSTRTIEMVKSLCLIFVSLLVICDPSFGWRTFWKGRRFDGNVGHPTDFKGRLGSDGDEDLWFNQKLDHFEPTNDQTWKQVLSVETLSMLSINRFIFLSEILRQRWVLQSRWSSFPHDWRGRRGDR